MVWFYSFFHTHNLNSLPEDEFYAIQDDYLLHLHQVTSIKYLLFERYRKATAIVLILLGLSMIWNNVYGFFIYLARDILNISLDFLSILSWICQAVPRTVAALLIIAQGVCLIRNKKQDLEP